MEPESKLLLYRNILLENGMINQLHFPSSFHKIGVSVQPTEIALKQRKALQNPSKKHLRQQATLENVRDMSSILPPRDSARFTTPRYNGNPVQRLTIRTGHVAQRDVNRSAEETLVT